MSWTPTDDLYFIEFFVVFLLQTTTTAHPRRVRTARSARRCSTASGARAPTASTGRRAPVRTAPGSLSRRAGWEELANQEGGEARDALILRKKMRDSPLYVSS